MSEIANWYYLDPVTKEYYVKYKYIETSSENLILTDGLYLVTQDITIDKYATSSEREKYVEEYNDMEQYLEYLEQDFLRYFFEWGYEDNYYDRGMIDENEFLPEQYTEYERGYNTCSKNIMGYTDCIINKNMDNIPELEFDIFTSITFPGLKINESFSIEFSDIDVIITKDFTLEKDANIKCKKLSF